MLALLSGHSWLHRQKDLEHSVWVNKNLNANINCKSLAVPPLWTLEFLSWLKKTLGETREPDVVKQ